MNGSRAAFIGVAAGAMLLAGPPAGAQTSRDGCLGKGAEGAPDAVIAACTSFIDTFARGEGERRDAAAAHLSRGNAHSAKGERELAASDYEAAVAEYDRLVDSEPPIPTRSPAAPMFSS